MSSSSWYWTSRPLAIVKSGTAHQSCNVQFLVLHITSISLPHHTTQPTNSIHHITSQTTHFISNITSHLSQRTSSPTTHLVVNIRSHLQQHITYLPSHHLANMQYEDYTAKELLHTLHGVKELVRQADKEPDEEVQDYMLEGTDRVVNAIIKKAKCMEFDRALEACHPKKAEKVTIKLKGLTKVYLPLKGLRGHKTPTERRAQRNRAALSPSS
ncbi:hypothetical protein BT63DRAFT_455675 [Microthyrium microscopicum]|uniref:Uncharacterized protein n=1 Tax=Microthyrium microscopicum TaxID=703497 RepID=A0A6A6UF17_9PEZI|nr:hypothetical protein BT63DRAFT_455675 [Microthyrium microscopicum]